MLLVYCLLLVACTYMSTAFSVVNKGDLNHDLHVTAEVVEELVRQMKENELRMKRVEERTARQIEAMQKEINTLRATSTCKCPDDQEHVNKKQQQAKRNAALSITSRAVIEDQVAFTALLSADAQHLGQNQNVAFDNVVLNDGNAYNPHDGVFMAPCTGTYVFSTTVTINARDVSHFGFAKNGIVLTTIFVDGVEKVYDSSAQTIALHLKTGDDVSVKHTESDKTLRGESHSLFSGFLLYRSVNDESVIG